MKKTKMSKIDELKQWVKDEICRWGQFKKFVEIVEDSGEGGGAMGYEYQFKFRFNIYTDTHSYRFPGKKAPEFIRGDELLLTFILFKV